MRPTAADFFGGATTTPHGQVGGGGGHPKKLFHLNDTAGHAATAVDFFGGATTTSEDGSALVNGGSQRLEVRMAALKSRGADARASSHMCNAGRPRGVLRHRAPARAALIASTPVSSGAAVLHARGVVGHRRSLCRLLVIVALTVASRPEATQPVPASCRPPRNQPVHTAPHGTPVEYVRTGRQRPCQGGVRAHACRRGADAMALTPPWRARRDGHGPSSRAALPSAANTIHVSRIHPMRGCIVLWARCTEHWRTGAHASHSR